MEKCSINALRDGEGNGQAASAVIDPGSTAVVYCQSAAIQVYNQMPAVQPVGPLPQIDIAEHRDQVGIKIVDRGIAGRAQIVLGDSHTAGRVEPVDVGLALTGVRGGNARGFQRPSSLSLCYSARQHDAVGAILQLQLPGRKIDRSVAVMVADRLRRRCCQKVIVARRPVLNERVIFTSLDSILVDTQTNAAV